MKKVRFGIVGLGTRGKTLAESLLEGNVKDGLLSAVYDIDSSQVLSSQIRSNQKKLSQKKLGQTELSQTELSQTESNQSESNQSESNQVKIYNTSIDMFKSGKIDAVIIATPHYFHPPLAMEAFSHKLHVMIESPAGVYTQQVQEMNEAAAKSNVEFGIMYQHRTNKNYINMRQMIHTGVLGKIKRTNWLVTDLSHTSLSHTSKPNHNTSSWRSTWKGEGGGILLNEAHHYLDLWQWICGMPSKVTAFCHEGKWHDIEVEDDVTAYVEYPESDICIKGATGVFIASTGEAPGTNRLEITGELGKLVYEKGKLEFFQEIGLEEENKREVIRTKAKYPDHPGVLSAFVEAILGRSGQYIPGEDGIKSLMLSNAMHLSAWLGKTIPLPLDDKMFLTELRKKFYNQEVL